MKLEIKTVSLDDGYDYRQKDIFLIDGEEIAEGSYGGEPEDNTKGRDYSWVAIAISEIAKKLGAEVEFTEKKVKTFDEFWQE